MPTVTIEFNGQTLELSEEVLNALVEIATRNGVGLDQALAQAIVNQKFLEDEVDGGAKLLIEKDDAVRHLEFA